MRAKRQSELNIKLEQKKNYVFKHKGTSEIRGANDLHQAQIIAGSPSWVGTNDKAKALATKEKAKAKAMNAKLKAAQE